MFVWFGSSTARFHIVDLERKSDEFKDIMVNIQHSTFNLVQNDTILQFGSQASLTCQVNIGLFSSVSQSVISYGCYKWIQYVRGYSFAFSEENNCTRITLHSHALTVILERSEIPYPSDTFQYNFLYHDDSNWFSTNPDPSTELFVKFRNATQIEPTTNRYDILTANYEMIIQKTSRDECKGAAAQIKGQLEIFTKFSVMSYKMESCIEGSQNSKCKLCQNSHYIHSLYGDLNIMMNGTTFSVQDYPTFRRGISPHPFHPIVGKSSQNHPPRGLSSLLEEEENLAIIICATIGGVLMVLATSIAVVGIIYVSRRRSEMRRPAYVPLK
ncbi:predicted protein [Naegleria gruberi]|uniref:Predicted protein n=1 Tax=Naegleria gruberi TaxID=5762 RepID=D2W1C7_NAEGR|nr:uncharacterized protein NAEGRDRAFT_75170 [Naegleria gruberi]EFC37203.1 predicted protein [Naegleria gruberi]|eukprot:XP_002669947.1 predicted protein [Naegleria gruberi strain NEG-M]